MGSRDIASKSNEFASQAEPMGSAAAGKSEECAGRAAKALIYRLGEAT